jgi:hypothetical protein
MTTFAPAGTTARRVEHVMGMPISLALRGRHAADDVGRAAWAGVVDPPETRLPEARVPEVLAFVPWPGDRPETAAGGALAEAPIVEVW